MTTEKEPFELNLSKDLETEGFDLEAGQTWIYPTNYAVRDYQYNIVQEALLKNTLVSLPTGLGKTFIAAVVMYNFFRWYPLGKVIFMAPTRPLVKQQIEACYDIMAIPKDVTVELTGTKLSSSREDIWKEKRVFFITPQILQNDMEKLAGFREKIKCLVFDEAHRARGNHAYCEVIRKLIPHNKYFRVLALSATPGSTTSDVLEVVKNLLISHLEFRTEESLDVRPYVFERNLTTVVVPLGQKLEQIRDDYLQVLEYYTRTLIKYKVVQGNCGNLTKGKIFMILKEFQQKSRNSSSNYAEIMKSLNICITLYHGFELLIRHGLRSFLSFFDEHIDKPLLKGNTRLIEIMNDVRNYLGPEPIIEQLPDGSFVEIPDNCKFGHPKFYKLRDILVSHFTLEDESTRVIVFFEYRNSVREAYALLNQARPFLKPRIFLGQGRGVTQRQQLNVVKSFKDGECNILLSTCIGEEGLDVGNVDLIVCFDISNKSPIRMVQRMGRTGRKKEGRVVVLVTEGKEQQVLKDCLIHKNNIAFHVLSSKELTNGLNADSPRLVPSEIIPKCSKIYITIKKIPLSKNSSLKDMFRNISNKTSEPYFPPDIQIVDIKDKIPKQENLWNKGNPLDRDLLISNVFSKKIEKQRTAQPIHLVKHSSTSELLVSILQNVDSKRFNIPVTQIGFSQITQNKNLKQGDIRSMFLKSQSSSNFLPRSQVQKLSPIEVVSIEENFTLHSKKLLSEISDYLSIEMSQDKRKCKNCPNNFNCDSFCITPQFEEITLAPQDESVLNITLGDLQIFLESQITKAEKKIKHGSDTRDKDGIKSGNQREVESPNRSNVNLEVDTDVVISQSEKSMSYQAPKTLDLILNKYSTSIVEVDEFAKEFDEKRRPKEDFENTSTDTLSFFKLNSIKDLFQNFKSRDSQETIINSPDIIENSFVRKIDASDESNDNTRQYNVSPVLCTFERARNVKNLKKKLFSTSQEYSAGSRTLTVNVPNITETNKPNLKKLNLYNSAVLCKKIDTPSKFSTSSVKSSSTPLCSKIQNKNFSEFCEEYNLQMKDSKNDNERKEIEENKNDCSSAKNVNQNKIDIDDLCDLSIFGISTIDNLKTVNRIEDTKKEASTTSIISEKVEKEILNTQINKHRITNIEMEGSCSAKSSQIFKRPNALESNKFARPLSSQMPSQTQVSITQLIDLINADEKNSTISRKENVDVTQRNLNSTLNWNSSGNPAVRKKKRANPFIENEAELSIHEDINISEDEDDEDQNLYEASFIDDGTQILDSEMHVKYLQTTRSPKKQMFKIPQKPNYFNIYSQEVPMDDTYLDDSFVVHDGIEDTQHELSELEILEQKLRHIQKKKMEKSDGKPAKKRRIRLLSDDSE